MPFIERIEDKMPPMIVEGCNEITLKIMNNCTISIFNNLLDNTTN